MFCHQANRPRGNSVVPHEWIENPFAFLFLLTLSLKDSFSQGRERQMFSEANEQYFHSIKITNYRLQIPI